MLISAPVYFIGSAGVGHTDKIGRLKELCEQYDIWLHVEGLVLVRSIPFWSSWRVDTQTNDIYH